MILQNGLVLCFHGNLPARIGASLGKIGRFSKDFDNM